MIHDIREIEGVNGKFSDDCGYTFGQVSSYLHVSSLCCSHGLLHVVLLFTIYISLEDILKMK
jgi:hypothetical protein